MTMDKDNENRRNDVWTLRGVCKESTGGTCRGGSAEVSHEKGTAVVTLRSEVSDEVLKKAVEEKDYTVVEIR